MPPIDDIDRKLIELLRIDGRTPTRALANEIGVSETTVASRLRQLRDEKIMQVTLRQDLYAKGFDQQCFADVYVSGRPIELVGRISRR